jgi:hypothetical protein
VLLLLLLLLLFNRETIPEAALPYQNLTVLCSRLFWQPIRADLAGCGPLQAPTEHHCT